MDTSKMYNDPIIGKRRSGTPDNPYLHYEETLQVINGRAVLTEIPNRFEKVKVKNAASSYLYEIEDGELKDNLFRVDYQEGVVFFSSSQNGKQFTFTYLGEGVHYFPADRLYLEELTDDVFTVTEKFEDVDREILVQKTRVDQQIASVPQPSEVVDMRIDHKGKVYPVAKDRIDAEQAKIEEAYQDKNGVSFSSLRNRINAEQTKIENAHRDNNGTVYPSLKQRIDAEQSKIEEAYNGADGKKYISLKQRYDAIDAETASLERRILKNVAKLKSSPFKVGEYVTTLGYAETDDGGSGDYIIHNQVGKPVDIVLTGGLKAQLVSTETITPLQFGAKGDGVTDDTLIFAAIEASYTDKVVDLKGKTYAVSPPLPLKNKYANGTFKRLPDGRLLGTDYATLNRTGNSSSIYIGKDAGKNSLFYRDELITDGSYNNVGIGFESLLNNVKGYRNAAIGYRAMEKNIEGYYNVAIGDYALAANIGLHTNSADDSGSRNTAVGTNALRYNTTGSKNVGIGRNSGHTNTIGNFNTAVGYNAYSGTYATNGVKDNKTASYNTMLGYNAGFNTNADYNVGIGTMALYENVTGRSNIAIGHRSNELNKDASYNVAIGVGALANHRDSEGHGNTAVGTESLNSIKTGYNNTAVGWRALKTTIAGNPAIKFTNSTGIGANTRISGSNQCQLGNSGVTTYAYGAIQNRSDLRDKAEIRDTILGLEFIKKLRPVDYKWDYRDAYIVVNDDGTVTKLPKDGSQKGNRFHHGFIAQEVKAIIDSTGVDFGGFQDHQISGGEDLYSIGYSELIGPLVKAVQDLSAENEKNKTSIKTLQDEIKAIKAAK